MGAPVIAPDLAATMALAAVLDAPDLASARAAARAGLDRIEADAPCDILEPVDAAAITGKKASTIRRWAEKRGIGRKVGGRWMISRRKLAAVMEGGQ